MFVSHIATLHLVSMMSPYLTTTCETGDNCNEATQSFTIMYLFYDHLLMFEMHVVHCAIIRQCLFKLRLILL